jgi:hypothetical protein
MKKNLVIVILILIILCVGGIIFWYSKLLVSGPSPSSPAVSNVNSAPMPIPETSGQNQTNQPANENVFANDDFSLTYPAGWRSVPAMSGVSAMIVKGNENITNPEAKKMNFQSYLAVSYDSSEGKTKEQVIDYVKKEITSALPDVVFSNEKNLTVNSRDAYATEATFTKSGVNFHVLMVVVWGNGSDLWILSFNTLEELWQNYISDFEKITQSFVVKIKT